MTNSIVEKQKQINSLRKAVAQAKTRVNDAKRDVKSYSDYQEYARDDQHREHLKGLVAQAEARLAQALPALEKAQAELAAAEAALPPVKESQFKSILKWFSGSALVKAKEGLELLDASLEQGSWIPGASRKVQAAFKPNVAKKTLKLDRSYKAPRAESALDSTVNYGIVTAVLRVTLQDATRTLSDDALECFIDFWPVANAISRLDATRPMPVFTTMNASRTVSAELKRQGAVNVEVCPIKWELVEEKDQKTGKVTYHHVAILLWPEGTKHHTSRYAWGTDNNQQCHACGHAIRNNYNWVPLILTTEAGEKKSLWVGRDCAETLFGVKMDGDLELAEGQRK